MSNVRTFKAPDNFAAMILKHNPGTSKEMIASVIRAWSDLLDDGQNGEGKTIDMKSASPNNQVQMGGSTPLSGEPQSRWAVNGGLGGHPVRFV
jgi:hypothetical protein